MPTKIETKSRRNRFLGFGGVISVSAAAVSAILIATSCQKTDLSKAVIQYEESNGGYKVVGVANENKSLIKTMEVPSTYNGKPVNEIKEGALGGCAYLEEVTLPFIGKSADATGKEGLFGYVFGKEMSEGAGAYTWQQYMTAYDEEHDKETLEYSQAIIPNSLYKVTITGGNVIAPGAFSCCKYISEIHIENTNATKIGNYAFYYCSSMFDFTIPDKITEIEDKAFSRDYVLQQITIPDKVTKVGREAFSNNISLGLVYLPNSVDVIGSKAFYNLQSALIVCSSPSKKKDWASDWVSDGISICYGTENIAYCENALVALCNDPTGNGKYVYLIQWTGEWETVTLNIPDTMSVEGVNYPVKVIGARFFEENTHVTTVNLGKNITTIGSYAFSACDKLKVVNFTKDFVFDKKENTTLTSIGAYAFANCTSLQGYTNDDEFIDGILLPNNVTEIGNHAFYNCSNITHLRLPNIIETIGDSAFEGCERLLYGYYPHKMKRSDQGEVIAESENAIRVPRSITTIGKAAFKNCFRLQDDGETSTLYPMIYVEDNRESEGSLGSAKLDQYDDSVFENCGIYSKTGIYSRVIRVDFDLGFAQDPGVWRFGNNCFKNAYMNNFVVRNENLQEVGDYAFYAARPNFPDNAVKICHNVKTIGDYAFYNWTTCAGVTFEDVPDPDPKKDLSSHLEKIGKSAFRGMNNAGFKELIIPDCVYSIGEYAFYGCDKVETLHLPVSDDAAEKKYTTIEPYTFAAMTNLGRNKAPLVIPKNVINLEKYCFQSCSSMQEVQVACDSSGANPAAVLDRVSWSVFNGCTNLRKVKWNLSACTYFSTSVFANCTNLTDDATSTLGTTTLSSSTYSNCTNLTSATINKKVTKIDSSAFSGCSNLTTVTFETEGRTNNCTINTYAFKGCKKLTTIDLPVYVTSLGEQSFADCIALGTSSNNGTPTFHLPNQKCSINKNAFMGWTNSQTIGFYTVNTTEKKNIDTALKLHLYNSNIVLTRSSTTDPFKFNSEESKINIGSTEVNFVWMGA